LAASQNIVFRSPLPSPPSPAATKGDLHRQSDDSPTYLHVGAEAYPIADTHAAATGNKNALSEIAIRAITDLFRIGNSQAVLYQSILTKALQYVAQAARAQPNARPPWETLPGTKEKGI